MLYDKQIENGTVAVVQEQSDITISNEEICSEITAVGDAKPE